LSQLVLPDRKIWTPPQTLEECQTIEDFIECPELDEIRRIELKRECWFRGRLRYWARPGPQRRIYDTIRHASMDFEHLSPYVFNLHRRLGKTFLSVLLIIEACLRRPDVIAKFVCHTTSQAEDIIDEHWSRIMADCPSELIPKRHNRKHYTFRNERWPESRGQKREHVKSSLRLYGCKDDKGNKIRGTATDVIAVDECRELAHLPYTWGHVILPTFDDRPSPLAIMMSTPPDTMDHPFVSKYIPEAISKDRYFCVPASEDERWTKEKDAVYVREMGGRDSVAYRRELECELIPDLDLLILPEFSEKENKDGQNPLLYADRPLPSHYYAFAAGDFGGSKDSHGVLFGYFDFEAQEAFVENELWAEDIDSGQLIQRWKELEEETFREGQVIHLFRSLDTDSQRLKDFKALLDITIARAPHQELEINRALARVYVRQSKVRIHERCRHLVRQLKNGTRDPKNGKFDRKPGMGHMDLVASFLYFLRDVDRKKVSEKNPFPPDPLPATSTHFIPAGMRQRDLGWEQILSGKRA